MSIEIIVNDPALKGGACRCLLPSRPREATPDTPKGGLVRTIVLIDQSTVGTGARGIARIDHDDRDPGQLHLVRDKLPHAIDRMPHYESFHKVYVTRPVGLCAGHPSVFSNTNKWQLSLRKITPKKFS